MRFRCCGKEREGRYCNECGSPANEDTAIGSLLKYLGDKEKSYRKRASVQKDLSDGCKDDPKNTAWFLKSYNEHTAVADRWKSWISAIELLLNGNQGDA